MSEANTLQNALDATFAVAVDWISTIDESLSRQQVKRQLTQLINARLKAAAAANAEEEGQDDEGAPSERDGVDAGLAVDSAADSED